MKNLFLTCAMLLFAASAIAQKTHQEPNTTKVVSDPTAHPVKIDTVKNTANSKKNAETQKIGTGKKQKTNTTKIVSDPTAHPVKIDTIKNQVNIKHEKAGTGKKQKPNTTKIVSDPTANPVHLDTVKNAAK